MCKSLLKYDINIRVQWDRLSGFIYSLMDQSGSEERQLGTSTNWEEALHLYQNVIACESEALCLQATIKLAHLSNYAPESILVQVVPILASLLGSSSTTSNTSILKACAYSLKCIACQGEGRLALLIGQSGAIPSILSLLPYSEGHLHRVLLKCLRNIVTLGDANRMLVVRIGGLEIILNMLKSCSDGSNGSC